MKYFVPLLIALAAMIPSSMALRNSAIDETEFVQEGGYRELDGETKGSKASKGGPKGTKGPKGKGKGKGKYYPSEHPSAAPTQCEEKNPLVLYTKNMGNELLQIDPHCEDAACVGTFFPFKTHVYFDEHVSDKAGKALGHCTVVGFHDHIPTIYCLFSIIWDYIEPCTHEPVKAEMAVAGKTTPTGSTTYLGTATAGILKDLKYPALAETKTGGSIFDGGLVKWEVQGEFPPPEEMEEM